MKISPSGILKINIKGLSKKVHFKTNQTSFLTRLLFWERKNDIEYTSIFIELIKKMDVFLDVGANIGYYSILGGLANPNVKIYAFEPSIGAMIYLSENVRINDLEKQITIEVMALSDAVGEIEFHEIKNKKYPTIYNLSGEHNLGTKPNKLHQKIKVKSNTLDNYCEENLFNKIDLIKLDTEGCEAFILKFADKTIRQFNPIIICETLFNTIEDKLEEIMKQYDYEFYNHIGNGLKKVDSIIRNSDNGVRNCFFVPKNKIGLIKDFIITAEM
jgi:FkbM family methyltransferase